MTSGPWFVRFAGRRSGPFDVTRLRILARRGALTRMHAVSVDGRSWAPATSLRSVFAEDGSVVKAGAEATEIGIEPEPDEGGFGGFDGHEATSGPVAPVVTAAAARRGGARVRPVVMSALALATVMLCVPTARDDSGALSWWWSQGPLAISVRGLSCAAVLAAWLTAFMAPEPARSASVAGVAGVLSATGAASMVAWAPSAAVLAPIVALSAIMVALDAAGAGSIRFLARVVVPAAACVSIGSVVIGVWRPHGWAWGSLALGLAGAGSLAWAGILACRPAQPGRDRLFWPCIAAPTAAMAALFVTAFGALGGDDPMRAADAAVAACLVLAFATVSWAAAHEAAETLHGLVRDGQPPHADGQLIGGLGSPEDPDVRTS